MQDGGPQGHVAFGSDGGGCVLPCVDHAGLFDAVWQFHVIRKLISDAGHLGRRWLDDANLKEFAAGIAGDDAVLEILSHAAIGFPGEDHLKSAIILCGLHGQRFVDKAAVGGGVEDSDIRRDDSGDINLKLQVGACGNGCVSGQDRFQDCARGDVSVGEGQRPQQADGLGTEDCVEAG